MKRIGKKRLAAGFIRAWTNEIRLELQHTFRNDLIFNSLDAIDEIATKVLDPRKEKRK